jgi:hypothetical protein
MTVGQGEAEETNDVPVGGGAVSEGLDEGVFLLDHGTSLITSERQTVEVSQTSTSLGVEELELDLLEPLIGVVVQVGHVKLSNTPTKTLGLDLDT